MDALARSCLSHSPERAVAITDEGGKDESTAPLVRATLLAMSGCTHLNQVRDVEPGTDGCQECLQQGGWWVHLRMCLTCGHVGCCDSSPGHHATQHHHHTKHPLVRSMEPGEDWAWCYVDNVMLEPA